MIITIPSHTYINYQDGRLDNLVVGGNQKMTPNVNHILLPTGSDGREVLVVGSILVAILPSCQDMKTIAF